MAVKRLSVERICLMATARMLWNNGHTPAEIAEAMVKKNVPVSEKTVASWIETTGVLSAYTSRRPS
jgi:hypothetical protein